MLQKKRLASTIRIFAECSAYYAWDLAESTTREKQGVTTLYATLSSIVALRRTSHCRRCMTVDTVVGRHPNYKIQGCERFNRNQQTTRRRASLGSELAVESGAAHQSVVGRRLHVEVPFSRFSYLATLMDRQLRIVGWQFRSRSLGTGRTLGGSSQDQLIHHTDRGGQYAGKEYREVLRRAEIRA